MSLLLLAFSISSILAPAARAEPSIEKTKERLVLLQNKLLAIERAIQKTDALFVNVVEDIGVRMSIFKQRTACEAKTSKADLKDLEAIDREINVLAAQYTQADCDKIKDGRQTPGTSEFRYKKANIEVLSHPSPDEIYGATEDPLKASVYVPPAPVNGCTVNFIFQFRGLNGINPDAPSHPKTNPVHLLNRSGINAVIIAADGGDIGSDKTQRHFGNQDYLDNAIQKILTSLPKGDCKDQPLKAGNICLASYSGGYGAVQSIMAAQLAHPESVKNPANCFLFIDGMHFSVQGQSPGMAPILEIARRAQRNAVTSQGKPYSLMVAHTAVVPAGGMASTSDTANYLVNNTGIRRNPANIFNWDCAKDIPTTKPHEPVQTVAEEGRLRIIQLNQATPKSKELTQEELTQMGYARGSAEEQHAFALQYLPCLYAHSFCSLNAPHAILNDGEEPHQK